MTLPLMPKATAVWLVENTTLTFEQIADFCGLHPLEIQGIADGDVAGGITGLDPMSRGLLSKEAIADAEADPKRILKMRSEFAEFVEKQKKMKSRYTPVARRQEKPDAIAWLIKTYPAITDAQITKLIGTTKNTIDAIRSRSHWNMNNLRPRDPVLLGLCTQTDLIEIAKKYEVSGEKSAPDADQIEASAAE
jgi:uncharacterized protein